MRVVTFACQKGAAGKTTLAGHIGVQAELTKAGPVVLLDTDGQGALADWWNSRQVERPVFGQTALEQIEADIDRLRDLGFGLCIIDSPSAVTPAVEQVMQVSDLVVIPCRPSPHDLRAANATIEMVKALSKPLIFVLNGATIGEAITEDAAAALAEAGPVAATRICHRDDYAESMFDGGTVMESNPDGESSKEIAALWAELSAVLSSAAPSGTQGTPNRASTE